MDKLTSAVRRRVELALIGGPLDRAELLALGLTDPDLRRLVRRGHLRHVFGHYVSGGTDPSFARASAAYRCYSGSVLSHFTAARLLDLRTLAPRRPAVIAPAEVVWITRPPRSARRQRRPDVVLRTAGLTSADYRAHHRLRVTTPARTAVDLARELPLSHGLVTMDHALATSATLDDLAAVVERQAGWPGVRKAEAVLTMADPRSESVLESVARAGMLAAGLPVPVPQASFWTGRQWTSERVDFWWPQFRTFAEADGLAKYEAASVTERRRLMRRSFVREQYLADLGLEFVRFGWEDAMSAPHQLADRLRAAFARGARRGITIPWRAPDPTHYPLRPAA